MKKWNKQRIAIALIGALLAGILPLGQGKESQAAEKTEVSAVVEEAQTSDTAAKYNLQNPRTDSDGNTTWDCVYFGNYWQNDTNGDGTADRNDAKEPIKWRVLSVDGDDAFLLADQSLDCKPYNDTDVNVTWETCTMRSWLNGYKADSNVCGKDYTEDNFLNNAFSAEEQMVIWNTSVVNADTPVYGTEGGNDTIDKVYLLSVDEALNSLYGFEPDYWDERGSRSAKNTAYAGTQGAGTFTTEYSGIYAGYGYWYLRSPGYFSNYSSCVDVGGCVSSYGGIVGIGDDTAVRPALHLNLSSPSGWSYAGKVVLGGGETEESTSSPAPLETKSPSPSPTGKPGLQQGMTNSVITPVSPSEIPPVTTSSVIQKPGKVTGLKLKVKKKEIQASWKKGKGATGYEIWYSTSSKFANKKKKTVKTQKLTIKNLERKTYYVKVRAYVVRDGKRLYGAWSSAMKKKVK